MQQHLRDEHHLDNLDPSHGRFVLDLQHQRSHVAHQVVLFAIHDSGGGLIRACFHQRSRYVNLIDILSQLKSMFIFYSIIRDIIII